jgi:elongator complex protein 2
MTPDGQFSKRLVIPGHTDWIRAIKSTTFTTQSEEYGFTNGDLMIASASQDKYIRIWKLSRARGVKKESADLIDSL